jgi:uncharacterized protein (TIGR02594 family)
MEFKLKQLGMIFPIVCLISIGLFSDTSEARKYNSHRGYYYDLANGRQDIASGSSSAIYAAVTGQADGDVSSSPVRQKPLTREERRNRHMSGQKIQKTASADSGSSSAVVNEARRWIGASAPQLGVRRTLWCAAAMNKWLRNIGYRGTGSDMARSFANYGQHVSGPQIGAIAVMSRGKRGGHVGIVSGIAANGNPVIISGNHGRRVAESVYPRSRIYAYVMP